MLHILCNTGTVSFVLADRLLFSYDMWLTRCVAVTNHCHGSNSVFCKWNEKLYHEMYAAYLMGRSDQDPSIDWYESGIGFLDNYIIPLAKKLKECGIFGVSSDEYLTYALANRQEWAIKGRQVCREMVIRRMNYFGQSKPTDEVRSNHPTGIICSNSPSRSASRSNEDLLLLRSRDPAMEGSPDRGTHNRNINLLEASS